MDLCVFCGKSLTGFQKIVKLNDKGSNNINKTSIVRKESIITTPGQRVHQNCRRDYINPYNQQRFEKTFADF